MSSERIKGAVAFHCDLRGCDCSTETGETDFAAATAAAKEDGWQFRKKSDGWKHYCCDNHAEMAYRGQWIDAKGPVRVLWTDGTMYGRDLRSGEDAPKVQNVWHARLGRVVVVLVRGRRFAEDRWVVDFEPFLKNHTIGSTESMTPEQAQHAALVVVKEALAPVWDVVDAATRQPPSDVELAGTGK